MISVTSAQLSAWLAAFLFPLIRILSFIGTAPIFGNKQIPARVKVALAVVLTIVISPTVEVQPGLEPGSTAGIFVVFQQIMAGMAMGFTVRLIFTAVEAAGEIIGLQMGLGFASFYDPVNASYTPVVGQFLGLIAALAFLAMNGHLLMLEALANSFQAFPVTAHPPTAEGWRTLTLWGGSILKSALQLSLPVLGALIITNIALGVLTRSAPQLNLFAIGFPITLSIGLIMLALSIPYLAPLLELFTRNGIDTMLRAMHQIAPRP